MPFERARRRRFAAAALFVAALAGGSVAGAASPADRAAARQHVGQAEELRKHGKLAEACKHLEEGARLDPQLPTLLELAECNEQLGNVVDAETQWAAARDRAKHDEKPQSRSRAETRLAAVQKRVAHLTLQLAPNPAGAQVLRDDEPLEAASLASALPMNPGDHLIVVKLVGHDDAKYPVKLGDGDNQTLAIAAGPATSAKGSPPPVASSPPPSSAAPSSALPSSPAQSLPSNAAAEPATPAAQSPTGWWSPEHKAAVILGSAGIVGVGVGSALSVVGKRNADKHDSTFDRSLALGGFSLAGGGVLLVTAVVLFASAPSGDAAQHAHLSISPTLLVARNGSVLGATGEF